MSIPPPPPFLMNKPQLKSNGFNRSYPPPPPPLSNKPSSKNSGNNPSRGRVELLGDIHKGVKLKSSKHLMNDRSGPSVAEAGSSNKSSSCMRNGNSSSLNSFSLGSELSKVNLRSPRQNTGRQDIRQMSHNVNKEQSQPITSELNPTSTQRGSKPPILRPKPKISIPSFFFSNNLSGGLISNDDVNLKSRDMLGRKSSVDISTRNSQHDNMPGRPFATMSRTNGRKMAGNCFNQPNNTDGVQSFQQNRLLISSLFNNGSSGHLEIRRSSAVNLSSDNCDNDRSSGNSQNSSLSSTSMMSNDLSTSGRFLPTSNQDFPSSRRASRPVPPVPSVPKTSSDVCEKDGSSRNSQNSSLSSTSMLSNDLSSSGRFLNALSVEKNSVPLPSLPASNQDFPNSRRASRPLPPVPSVSKTYPDRLQKASINNQRNVPEFNPVQKSNFELRFHFRDENDFPKPHGFVGFKKFYPSKSWKNPINQQPSSMNNGFTKLVTTV